jgi:LacI family transcriptional regulator
MTQRRIAQELNISIATVSLALRNSPKVKESTRRAVLECAEKFDYRPNQAAVSLSAGKSFTVGVLISSLRHPFYADLLNEIQRALRDYGYIALCLPTDIAGDYREAVKALLARNIDGLISIPVKIEDYAWLRSLNLPLVFSEHQDGEVDSVSVDRKKSGFILTEHLIGLGHLKIGFLGGGNSLRFSGFRAALDKHGLATREEWIRSGGDGYENGLRAMREILALPNPPTALICHNDLAAIGAMRAVYSAGKSVPDDFAVVGFDNIAEGNYLRSALTTVEYPRAEIAQKLAELLVPKIGGALDNKPRKTIIEPRLIVRESCGACLNRNRLAES